MNLVVEPSAVKSGSVRVPGDKSISHRALMLGGIASGKTRIRGMLTGEDCLATQRAMQSMGVRIRHAQSGDVEIEGVGAFGLRAPETPLDMGNSGTAMRLFAGLLSGQSFSTELVGDDSLTSRPMGRVTKPLLMMGAKITSNDGRPPLQIEGGQSLIGINYSLPVASAQVKSAILLASFYTRGEISVFEPAVTRDHTERMLRSMGMDMSVGERRTTLVGGQTLTGIDIEIPADLSSASFLILAAILSAGAEVKISDVGVNATRTGVIDILRDMGADISVDNVRLFGEEPVADLTVRASRLHGIDVNREQVSLAIDEFPLLFVAASCARGTTRFDGIEELRVKESDRISSMSAGLRTLGIIVEESDDGAIVHGGKLSGGTVQSFGDHRVAMSFAVAATVAGGAVHIDDTASVNTSFPGFPECLRSLGVDISEHRPGDSEITGWHTEVPVIAIDGPSGSGKGTIARRVAEALGFHLLDSGALYRLVALAMEGHRDSGLSDEAIAHIAANLNVKFSTDEEGGEQVWLEGIEVSDQIRTEDCGRLASKVAAIPEVRSALLERQKAFRQKPGLVADGRDMGTKVFPDAGLKVFLTASAIERAKRRHKQLNDKGMDVSLAALSRDIEDRDRRDSERSVAPLRPAEDARLLDSSNLTIDEVTRTVIDWVSELDLRERI